jgi:integrase
MSRKSVPSYRLHKASGQARTIVNGKHVYLGKFNSEESRTAYARILAESSQPCLISATPSSLSQSSIPQLILIAEVIVKYLEFAEVNYAVDGEVGKEFVGMVASLKPLDDLYGDDYAYQFGPLKLKALRQHFIDCNLCRTEIIKRIGRIKRAFKWAGSEELVPTSLYEGLRPVTGPQYRRTSARESEPVKPVAESDVEATLPFMSPQVAAMVQLQPLPGMRPSEVISMTPSEINREGDAWLYEPSKHKNRWRSHQRVIPFVNIV